MKFALVALLFALIYSVQCKPQEDIYGALADENAQDEPKDPNYGDYDTDDDSTDAPEDDDETSADEAPPKIVSTQQIVSVQQGQNVTLHCNVTNIGGSVILWKKDGTLIYQASTKLGHGLQNTKVENDGQTFNIFHATVENHGTYGCHVLITADKELSLIHTVEVKVPPIIISLTTENNSTVFDMGESVTLICSATGVPKPTISWHLNDRLNITGEKLTIENIKLKDAGLYRCLADNGLKPAHQSIRIDVNHKPIVTINEYVVSSDESEDIELKCEVRGYPAPIVVWQKNGHNVLSSGNIKVKHNQHQSILYVNNAAESDFGTYLCSAKNVYGKAEKSVEVVKTPAVLHMESRRNGKDLKITVKVKSKTPVTKYDLEYRKKGETEWNKVEPEVTGDHENHVYTIEYVLKNVEAGTYEARAKYHNKHGWSKFSKIHEITAKHHNNKHKNKLHKEKEVKAHEPITPPAQHQETMYKETPVGESQTGGSTMLSCSIILLSIALISNLW